MTRGVSPLARTIYVRPGEMTINTTTEPLPGGALTGGMAKFLTGLALRLSEGATEATVLVDGLAAEMVGFPATLPANGNARQDVPAFGELAGHGWRHGVLAPFTTFYREGYPSLYVGIVPWIAELEPERFPLGTAGEDPVELSLRCYRWHVVTGTAWRGTPGVTGTGLLRQLGAGKGEPNWKPARQAPLTDAYRSEVDYTPRQWHGDASGPQSGLEDGWDARLQYLSAAMVAELPTRALARVRKFDPKLGGYWRVRLSTWNHPGLPDPAGYERGYHAGEPRESVRWVTTPTLALLDQLTTEGVYGGFEVIEGYASETARVTRTWAERLRDAHNLWDHTLWVAEHGGGGIATGQFHALKAATKACYRETIGLFGREGGRIDRPEWQDAIISQARTNLWRKLWRVGKDTGRWPVSIDRDTAWFAIPEDGTPAEPIPGLDAGTGLGKFRHYGTRKAER